MNPLNLRSIVFRLWKVYLIVGDLVWMEPSTQCDLVSREYDALVGPQVVHVWQSKFVNVVSHHDESLPAGYTLLWR